MHSFSQIDSFQTIELNDFQDLIVRLQLIPDFYQQSLNKSASSLAFEW